MLKNCLGQEFNRVESTRSTRLDPKSWPRGNVPNWMTHPSFHLVSWPPFRRGGQIHGPWALVYPGGRYGRTLPIGPISFIFMQFSAKILQNNRFSAQTQGLALPRLGNPGSATVEVMNFMTLMVKIEYKGHFSVEFEFSPQPICMSAVANCVFYMR